jgi:hypothetical protein
VALSTTEAEYIAAATTTKEALWLRALLRDLGIKVNTVPLKGDNQSAISLIKHPALNPRSKHIDIRHHAIRERAACGDISISYVPTAEMVADVMTKALDKIKFDKFRSMMGMLAISRKK